MGTPQSLVLMTVDCMRADHASFLGYDRPTTPFLATLAAESLVFRNAIVSGAPTYYSFPSMVASRHPLALGRDVVGLAPEEPTIATALAESGYATAAFVAGNPYLTPRFGYDTGFDVFRDFLAAGEGPIPDGLDTPSGMGNARSVSRINRSLAELAHKLGSLGSLYDELYFRYCQRVVASTPQTLDELRRFPAADVIVDQACEWLAGVAGRPFFLWLHFMDPHSPYYPPQEALNLLGYSHVDASQARYLNSYWNRGDLGPNRLRRHREEVIRLYDAGIRWTDAQAARLVDVLRQRGVWENCVLAFTADHGEEFLDHGDRYHAPRKVTEELVHVPLLIRVSGISRTEPVNLPFSLLDLAPTLLEVVDAQVPGSFRGSGRWAQLQNGLSWEQPAIIECVTGCTNPFRMDKRLGARILGVREGRYKLVIDFGNSSEAFFDLESDPAELRPLPPDAEKPVRRRLLERARHHLASSLQSRDPDARLAARLRDLRLEWAN